MESRFAKYLRYWYQEKTPEERELYNFNLVPLHKYLCSGIYTISVNNVILYVGKSVNVHSRLRDHIYHINEEKPHEHKYRILKQLKDMGYAIQFNLLERVDDEDLLLKREAEHIRLLRPVLNSQHNGMVGSFVSLQYVLQLVGTSPKYEF